MFIFLEKRPNVLQNYNDRFDPLQIKENEFKSGYRFSKENVKEKLFPLLNPSLINKIIGGSLLLRLRLSAEHFTYLAATAL